MCVCVSACLLVVFCWSGAAVRVPRCPPLLAACGHSKHESMHHVGCLLDTLHPKLRSNQMLRRHQVYRLAILCIAAAMPWSQHNVNPVQPTVRPRYVMTARPLDKTWPWNHSGPPRKGAWRCGMRFLQLNTSSRNMHALHRSRLNLESR